MNFGKYFLVAFFAVCLAVSAQAQIFYGAVSVSGTTNALVQANFQTVTNYAYVSLPSRGLQIGNINTNQTITVWYGFTMAGATNVTLVTSNVYTFPASNGWANGATFTTNVAQFNYRVPVTAWGQIGVGNYTNTVSF